MKTYKAVLKSSLVMLVLFAVAGSGVAQAQTCQARAINAEVVRAEGITEMVGDIELQCRRATVDTGSFFDATIPDTLDITVRLNTNITNDISDARVVIAEDGDRAARALLATRMAEFCWTPIHSWHDICQPTQRYLRQTSGTVNSRKTATLSSGRTSPLPLPPMTRHRRRGRRQFRRHRARF